MGSLAVASMCGSFSEYVIIYALGDIVRTPSEEIYLS
jgi:hypothetical protein